MDEYQNLQELLVYLSGPIGAVAWFILVSSFVRNLREKGYMEKWASWLVQLVPPEVIITLQPWWALVASVSFAYLVQQGYYVITKPGKFMG